MYAEGEGREGGGWEVERLERKRVKEKRENYCMLH